MPKKEYIPKQPTSGWMLTELAKHGVHLRGRTWTDQSLVKMLIERLFSFSVTVGAPRKL